MQTKCKIRFVEIPENASVGKVVVIASVHGQNILNSGFLDWSLALKGTKIASVLCKPSHISYIHDFIVVHFTNPKKTDGYFGTATLENLFLGARANELSISVYAQ